ncbi:MAG: response regulator [Roseinatronobacter sp.]
MTLIQPSYDDLLRERRARLRAERLYEQVKRELRHANETLRAHAFALSDQVIAQRDELCAIRDRARTLEGVNTQVTQDLSHAHTAADLANMRLREAIETLRDGFAVFDAEQRLVLANRAYLSPFRNFAEVQPGIRYQRVIEICAYEGVVQFEDCTPEDWVAQMMMRWSAPVIPAIEMHFTKGVSVRLTDRRVANGDLVSLATDITESLRYQAELITAQRKAEAAAEAKAAFLATMSHEIRTPMNGVVGMAELLGETDLDGEQRSYVETITSSGQALVTIINDILDFSKMDAGRMELYPVPVDLEKVLHDVLTMMAQLAQSKGIELILDFDIFLPSLLMADHGRLRQIVTNLVGNAVKFTDSGYVLVRAVGVGTTARGLMVNITVEDTGIGISKENQDHIFTAFSQVEDSASRRFEGTGLGLAITRQIVLAMGGTMWVESDIGIGSCFGVSLELPLGPGQHQVRRLEVPAGIASALLVSDRLISREIIARRLHAAGVSVQTATLGDAALRQLVRTCPDFALIDQDMGAERVDMLLAELARVWPELPIVLMCSSVATARAAFAEGRLRAVLPKPVLWRDLVAALAPPDAAESVVSGGAAAALAVPDGRADASRHLTPAPMPDPLRMTRKPRVLYAEDNKTNQIVFSKMLKALDIDLHLAENGHEAVRLFRELSPDLIFMDVSMPEMDGREATRQIRAMPEGRLVPIIACTAHALHEEIERILEAGMNTMLTKPLRKQELLAALREHLPGHFGV